MQKSCLIGAIYGILVLFAFPSTRHMSTCTPAIISIILLILMVRRVYRISWPQLLLDLLERGVQPLGCCPVRKIVSRSEQAPQLFTGLLVLPCSVQCCG